MKASNIYQDKQDKQDKQDNDIFTDKRDHSSSLNLEDSSINEESQNRIFSSQFIFILIYFI